MIKKQNSWTCYEIFNKEGAVLLIFFSFALGSNMVQLNTFLLPSVPMQDTTHLHSGICKGGQFVLATSLWAGEALGSEHPEL